MKNYHNKKCDKIGMKTGKIRNLPTTDNLWDMLGGRVCNPNSLLINKKTNGKAV